MARRRKASLIGVERARQQLPALLDRAHQGETTVITKHGKPYAALVPIEQAHADRPSLSFMSLRGSGRGLWGEIGSTLKALREEWT